MKECSKCLVARPFDAFSKSKGRKDGLHVICKACDAARRTAQRQQNIDRERARDNARYTARRDEKRAYDRAYYATNSDRMRAATAEYQRVNRERLLPFHAARQTRRRANKLQQTPAWADHAKITAVYELAAQCRQLGLDVEVDHEIPLQGELVSGLHVHQNLRVCLSSENKSKSNRFDPAAS